MMPARRTQWTLATLTIFSVALAGCADNPATPQESTGPGTPSAEEGPSSDGALEDPYADRLPMCLEPTDAQVGASFPGKETETIEVPDAPCDDMGETHMDDGMMVGGANTTDNVDGIHDIDEANETYEDDSGVNVTTGDPVVDIVGP